MGLIPNINIIGDYNVFWNLKNTGNKVERHLNRKVEKALPQRFVQGTAFGQIPPGRYGRGIQSSVFYVPISDVLPDQAVLQNNGGGTWLYYRKIQIKASSHTLPAGYTVKLELTETTTPTASAIYNKSLSSGNDVRIIDNYAEPDIELDRKIEIFTNTHIVIWFKLQRKINANSSDSNYYLIYGNSLAGLPPENQDNIFTKDFSITNNDDGLGYGNDKLTLLHHCDDGSGTISSDSSGSGAHGTFVNSPAWVGSDVYFNQGDRLRFFANNDYIKVPNHPAIEINTVPFTISMRVKLNVIPAWQSLNYQRVILFARYNKYRGVYAALTDNLSRVTGKITFVVGNENTYKYVNSVTNLQINQLYFLTFVHTGSKLLIYINGELDVEASVSLVPNGAGADLRYPEQANAQYDGEIDDFRIYKREVGASEIKAYANWRKYVPSDNQIQVNLQIEQNY